MMDDRKNDAEGADEQALRSLLSGAVQSLEPSEGALERLRYAVPARRARKRQVLVCAAAAAVLAGAAVPTALHLTGAQGSATDHSTMAGHGQQQDGANGGTSDPHQNGSGKSAAQPTFHPGAGQTAGGTPSPRPSGSPSDSVVAGPSGTASAGAASGSDITPRPPVGAAGAVPGCSADQLGVLGSARAPRADGKVYGSFKVTNVSGRDCTVTGPDTVTAASVARSAPPAQGSGVTVLSHTAGDPASELLPDPAVESASVVLEPNAAYEVRFAWVPSAQSCPAASAGPTGRPPAGGTGEPPAGTQGAGADGAAASDPVNGGAGADPAGVAVSHTPEAGAPTTQTTIPDACGGTVYRTGAIALGASTR
ncbi:hypothetical protein ACWGCI_23430 [Streptomyces sp. NPDC054949]|uniref:hypothetical protein n=1 Tax=unclassified Streptomyces TaxID=2593676 RepID=UPI00224E4387|nr:hypothetical protein [Streptomyces sp. NBC_00424]MCX5074681.1 hypothetical protein [Streptomyces sp. NBC_00424]WUD42148.1 hypothetical protein OHA84_17440 [Streptomyces sp. NBC_00513]